MTYTQPVTTTLHDPAALPGYQLRLPSFEGPLDVLLRLIERSQLAIADVSLIAVTDQFLSYVAEMGGADPASIAEFANVGTRLVLLKSRSLLPRPPALDDEELPSELTQELIEYRTVKLAAMALAERDRRGDGAFARTLGGIAAPAVDAAPKLALHEPSWLARAIRRRLTVTPSPPSVMQIRPLVTLREMVERVLQAMTIRPMVRFSTIAGQCRDAHEVRTAFLALLVLVRRRAIDAEQIIPFGEITLSRAAVTPSFLPTERDAFPVEP